MGVVFFLQTDPFGSKQRLSNAEQNVCVNQTVPTLRWLLEKAQLHNKNVMFDIKTTSQCSGHPYADKFEDIILDTIFASGIYPEKVCICLKNCLLYSTAIKSHVDKIRRNL